MGRRPLGLVLCLLLGACSEGPADTKTTTGTTTITPTDTADTGFWLPTTTSSSTISTYMMSMSFSEYLSREIIVGAEVTLNGLTEVTADNGYVHFPLLAGELYEATLQPAGHGPVRMYGLMGNWRHIEGGRIPSNDSRDLLATMFSADLPAGTGIVSVTPFAGNPTARVPLENTRAEIDVPAAVILAENLADQRGFTPGDTSLTGQNSTIVFAGVPAGPINISLTPPNGYTCVLEPATITVAPDGYSNIRYYCQD